MIVVDFHLSIRFINFLGGQGGNVSLDPPRWLNPLLLKIIIYLSILPIQATYPPLIKAPICLLVSHQPPAWIFCNRIYHHYFYLHISAMLNKQAIGIVSIAMNITLTNVSV